MKTCLLVVAFVALLGPAAAWAGRAATPSNARLLLVATDGTAADAASESERMLQRIQRLRRIQRRPMPAPYGTGFEMRKEMSVEGANSTLDPIEWPERIERMERPGRRDRPAAGGARRGGR